MTRVHAPAIERISKGSYSGPDVARLFEEMAEEAAKSDSEGYHVCISFLEEDDEFVEGTYVPELHLTLRKIEDE